MNRTGALSSPQKKTNPTLEPRATAFGTLATALKFHSLIMAIFGALNLVKTLKTALLSAPNEH